MSRQRLPPKAAIAPPLLAKLTELNLSSAQLLEDFLEWKSSDEEDSSYFFAKDGLNRGSKHLAHAHILPTVSADRAAWDFAYERFRKRTSDRYLFYVDGGFSYGYLLLDIVADPGAHAVWDTHPNNMKALEAAAEAFFFHGSVPEREAP